MELSVCIITKNENPKLKRCLESLTFLKADIVVVDTGFNDETKDLVRSFAGRYFTFEWCDDFAAARNYALKQAYYDDIMVIDSDEWLAKEEETFNKAALENFIRRDLYTLACCYQVNIEPNIAYGEHHAIVPRIFSKRYFHYEGKAHEQPVPLGAKANSRTITIDLKMYHDGYAGKGVVKAKSKRNLALLLQDLKDKPDNAYLLFQVGMSYLNLEEYEYALKYFEKELANRDFNYSFVYAYDVVYGYLKALMELKQYELVLTKIDYFAKKFPNLADFWYDIGNIFLQLNDLQKAVVAFERATKCSQVTLVGKDGDFAYYNLGQIYIYLGEINQAISYYEKCHAEFTPAQEALLALRQQQLAQAVTIYVVDTLNSEVAIKKTLISLANLPFKKVVVSKQGNYQQLGADEQLNLDLTEFSSYLNQTTNLSLLMFGGEELLDYNLSELKQLVKSPQIVSGYGLVVSPNQVKELAKQSYYHELRLVSGSAHRLDAGQLMPVNEFREVLVSLTIASPLDVRESLNFKKNTSAYANLLFMQGAFKEALAAFQAYFKDCDYGLEESLHSAANAILTSVFLQTTSWLEKYLTSWQNYYQTFGIFQFSLGYYFQALGDDKQAQLAFLEAAKLANSLNPKVNQDCYLSQKGLIVDGE